MNNQSNTAVVEQASRKARPETRLSRLSDAKPACRQGDIILCLVPATAKFTRDAASRVGLAEVQLAQGTTRGSRHIARLPESWQAFRQDGPYRTPSGGTLMANVLLVAPAAGGEITVDHPEHAPHVVHVPAGYNLLACSQVDHASEALQRVRD